MAKLTLDYLSRRKQPWGPVLFPPSLRSCVLLVLAALAALWVARRHDPWVFIGPIPVSEEGFDARGQRIWFNDRDDLVVRVSRCKLQLRDHRTGAKIRDLFESPGPICHVFPLLGGRQMLVFHNDSPTATILDAHSGAIVRRIANLACMGLEIAAVNDEGSRVICTGRFVRAPDRPFRPHRCERTFMDWLYLFDLSAPHAPESIAPVRQWPDNISAALVASGKRILLSYSQITGRERYEILDAASLETIAGGDGTIVPRDPCLIGLIDPPEKSAAGEGLKLPPPEAAPSDPWKYGWSYSTRLTLPGTPSPTLNLYDPMTGRVQARLALPRPMGGEEIEISADGSRLAWITHMWSPTMTTVQLHHTATGRTAPPVSVLGSFRFMPGGRSFLLTDAKGGLSALFKEPDGPPLALLPHDGGATIEQGMFSADGQVLARSYPDGLRIIRRIGGVCRESPIGALGMPHVWLLCVLVPIAALSLASDTRRRRGPDHAAVPGWINLLIFGTAAPISLFLLLSACIGTGTPAWLLPWPALLLAAVHLNLGSPLWRWGTLIALAAAIGSCAWAGQELVRTGTAGWTPFALLGRVYTLPRILPVAFWAAAAAMLAATALGMFRSPRGE